MKLRSVVATGAADLRWPVPALKMPPHSVETGMAIDGKWEITINSPMGAQKATLDLKNEGGTLSGTQTAMQGTQPLSRNAYKVQLFPVAIYRTVLLAAGQMGRDPRAAG